MTRDRSEDRIEIPAPGRVFYLTLLALAALAPTLVGVGSLSGLLPDIPPRALPTILAVLAAVELPVLIALGWLGTRRRVVLRHGELDLRAAFYRRRVALADLTLDQARVIDLRERREFRPRLKTNGYAVPGLAAGNFRDRAGNKLFCLVTQPQALRLPLSDGSALLLSPANPRAALDQIRQHALQ